MSPQLHHIKYNNFEAFTANKLSTMMISTPLRSKILSHTRSTSLPSRSHPLIPQFNEYLQRLKPCDSTPSISLSSIGTKLHNLEDLYNCIDDLLLLPHTHQAFASHEKWVGEILDGYLGLVDACGTAKEFIFQAKEYVLGVRSVLRRRRDSDEYLSGFLNSRKMEKKTIQKSLRSISSFKNKTSVLALDKDQETIAIISMMREAESVTLDLIQALLLSIKGSRITGWSLVSKLRKFSGQDHKDAFDQFGDLDAALEKLVGFRTSKCMQIDDLQQQLRHMNSSIEAVEETLDCLFKRLIKTRVSLLNMHSQ